MVTDTAYYHALEDIALLKSQRDRLREALLEVIASLEPGGEHDLTGVMDEARAALKATENTP